MRVDFRDLLFQVALVGIDGCANVRASNRPGISEGVNAAKDIRGGLVRDFPSSIVTIPHPKISFVIVDASNRSEIVELEIPSGIVEIIATWFDFCTGIRR